MFAGFQLCQKQIKIATGLETGSETGPLQQHCVFTHLLSDGTVTHSLTSFEIKMAAENGFPGYKIVFFSFLVDLFLCRALGQFARVLMFVFMEI